MLSALTGFDYLVLFVLLACVWLGYRLGIVIIFFIVLSLWGGDRIAQQYAAQWGMSHGLVLFGSLVVILLSGYVINRLLVAFLGILNDLAGALAGVLLGLILVSVAILPLSKLVSPDQRKIILSSCTMRYLAPELERRFPAPRIDTSKIRLPLPPTEGSLQKAFDFTLATSTVPAKGTPPAVEKGPKKR